MRMRKLCGLHSVAHGHSLMFSMLLRGKVCCLHFNLDVPLNYCNIYITGLMCLFTNISSTCVTRRKEGKAEKVRRTGIMYVHFMYVKEKNKKHKINYHMIIW